MPIIDLVSDHEHMNRTLYMIRAGLLLLIEGSQVLLSRATEVNVFTDNPQGGRLTQIFQIRSGKAGRNVRELIQLEAR